MSLAVRVMTGLDNKLYMALSQPHNVTLPYMVEMYKRLGPGGAIGTNCDGSERKVLANGTGKSGGMTD